MYASSEGEVSLHNLLYHFVSVIAFVRPIAVVRKLACKLKVSSPYPYLNDCKRLHCDACR